MQSKPIWLRRMNTAAIYLLALVIAGLAVHRSDLHADEPQPELEPGFVALFDGKSFEGWEGNMDYFRVEDSAIVAGSLKKKIPNNEFLCTKKKLHELRLTIASASARRRKQRWDSISIEASAKRP